MDRRNFIVAAIAVAILVVVGAVFLWPESTEQAAVTTPEPAAEGSAEGGASTTESGGY